MAVETNRIIGSFIAILVGVILIPVVYQASVDANLTGSLATIVSLIPLLFALGILVVSLRGML